MIKSPEYSYAIDPVKKQTCLENLIKTVHSTLRTDPILQTMFENSYPSGVPGIDDEHW